MSVEFNDRAQAAYGKQDYSPKTSIEGLEIHQLRRFNDDGGSMTELARLTDGGINGIEGFTAKQMNYSTMEPQAIKAFHLHQRQTDVWFVPPTSKALLVVGDVRKGSATEGLVQRLVLGDGKSFLVRIPPGVAHGVKSLLTAQLSMIIYFVDVQFSIDDQCDEGRLPWDHFGEEVWDVERG